MKQALDFKNSPMIKSNPSLELCISLIEYGYTSCSSSGAELTIGDAWASEHEKDSGSQHAGPEFEEGICLVHNGILSGILFLPFVILLVPSPTSYSFHTII